MKKIIYLVVFLFIPLLNFAQDAAGTIDGVISKMDNINDYSADLYIKSDIPLIRILPVRATIFFKQKDNFRIKSKGIAILPKEGFNDISSLLKDKSSYNPLFSGYDTVMKTKTEVITILPNQDTSDLVLAKLWIDKENSLILKSQVTTRFNGTVLIEYFHPSNNSFGLPDSMVFTVDVKKFKIPKGVATDINRTSARDEKPSQSKTGKIYIRLTNYRINKGIDDAIFKK